MRGALKKYLSKMINPEKTSVQQSDEENDVSPREAQHRNEEIFKNLTFDDKGNPLQQHFVDGDKMVIQVTQPRFRVSRKKHVLHSKTLMNLVDAAVDSAV